MGSVSTSTCTLPATFVFTDEASNSVFQPFSISELMKSNCKLNTSTEIHTSLQHVL